MAVFSGGITLRIGKVMAILSQLSEAVFTPRCIKAMTAAYELLLEELQLVDRADPVTKVSAEAVILVYRAGYTEPEAICKRALRELGVHRD
jgi:hypothetical protein